MFVLINYYLAWFDKWFSITYYPHHLVCVEVPQQDFNHYTQGTD